LLDDLLDAVRVGDGDATLVRADWDVDVLIAETVDGLGATAAERGITLRAVPSGLGSVYADRKRVRRALTVLTSQALELGKLGCEIVVRARHGESCVRFEVSAPDGSRTAPSGHAFEIMRCTCKRLVEAHHGTLGLDQLGGRQTFWFTLLTEPACLT
jgi:signal transduction histidine kinase